MVVEHIAIYRLGPHLPTAHPDGVHWVATQHPRTDVEVMNVLLDMEIGVSRSAICLAIEWS